MNNQMPYMDNNFGGNPNSFSGSFQGNFNNQPPINMTLERINNRINRLERQVKILENRVNRLASSNPQFLNNDFDDNNNMYML